MMDEETSSASEVPSDAQFTVDLREIELTDEEVGALQNAITKLAVQFVQQSRAGELKPPREPFVKIIFVRSIPPR